jgi:hypothetical protein
MILVFRFNDCPVCGAAHRFWTPAGPDRPCDPLAVYAFSCPRTDEPGRHKLLIAGEPADEPPPGGVEMYPA